jgi:hypothetical protein
MQEGRPLSVGQVLPADDPVSSWLLALGWAFGDMQVVHVALESEDDPARHLRLVSLAWIYFREGCRLLGMTSPGSQHTPPEIKAFFQHLPADVRAHSDRARAIFKEQNEAVLGLRNRFSHYPYPTGHTPEGEPADGSQRAWEVLPVILSEAASEPFTWIEGKARDGRLSWADELYARYLLNAFDGDAERFSHHTRAMAEGVTELVRFANKALSARYWPIRDATP